jgi:hypothetical protein
MLHCETPNTYRAKALRCLRVANKVHDSGERVALLSLACNYMSLADYVGRRHEHRATHQSDQGPDTQ